MLYLVGLGLADESDITVKGLEVVKRAERVYLEAYTSILLVSKEKLEAFYGRPVIEADRELVETGSDEILAGADKTDVAFLVVGDPFGATTHTDLVLRAREMGIESKVIPNASIMSGIGCTGLQLYNFGQTVSMVFFTENWKPSSYYDRVKENVQLGLHTLVLLDIKVKEQSYENMARGRRIFEPPRYMTVAQCASQMLETEEERKEGVFGPDSLAVGAARVGGPDQKLVVGTLKELSEVDMGPPLHSLVLLGRKAHDLERDYIREFAVDKATFDASWKKGFHLLPAMPVYMVHGFRWPRAGFTGIRVYIVLHNLEDATAEYVQQPATSRLLTECFKKTDPDIVARLPDLQFIEQYDPEDTDSATAVSQPYAYVAAKVITLSEPGAKAPGLSWNPEDLAKDSPLEPSAMEALTQLRDKYAAGERIGWWIVYNGDPDRAFPHSEEDDSYDEYDYDDNDDDEYTESNGDSVRNSTAPETPPSPANRQGKTRLAKWYAPYSDEEKIKLKGEVHRLVAPRDQKYQSNFVEFKRSTKIVYRRYAGLFFCVCVDATDNELAYLEAIHFFVEVLDQFFGNVCELDLVFNFYKVYAILDEVFLAGEIEETSKQVVLTRLEHLDKLE
ncbi:diphthine methyl ester synthase [Aspergillus lentulus]|uniref:AP-2 complex subunit sigma n=1 Tax=Aspergillus lentulus TaxID=293939 RepID=A0AAN4PQ18_ASPLE|nr:hypothetical protein CNMCM6069_001856 [Aspergillus lentulus]KAF4164586.1 hypothetical protein CNMCM6936_008940 [Aspergillus lentulus]KAF4179894.1 hypothetical protein CNMCM7927_001559 [Aspergillus lentulus]KAF4182527.1 hypothetical protein CNMCM8060_006931 [Aspergillus lentulus]KAF4192521.1 hypothetical protein CNMCM8694_000263 [Aspergillus lentulus]